MCVHALPDRCPVCDHVGFAIGFNEPRRSIRLGYVDRIRLWAAMVRRRGCEIIHDRLPELREITLHSSRFYQRTVASEALQQV